MVARVSIVIPTYQPGELFRATLRACLRQDYGNVEVVIALDGDDEVVRAAVEEADDPRVRLVADGQRRGQFANFNRAVDESTGEFIKLFSADDLMARDCVRTLVEAMEAHPGVGICSSRHVAFSSGQDGRLASWLHVPDRVPHPVIRLGPEAGRRHLALYGNQLGGPSNVMLRRSAWWASGGFDPRIGHLGDLAYWGRVVGRGGLLIVERPLVGYRIHENSVTGRDGLRFVRIDEMFAIADDATLGAWFPGRRWWRRLFLRLMAINATVGYAVSMVRRSPWQGALGLCRVLGCGGPLLLPLTVPVAAWCFLRSSVLRLGPLWPLRAPWTSQRVEVGTLDEEQIVDLLSDPDALARLAEEPR